MPFGPDLPKGVRTPSTKTTSRSERGRRSSNDTGPPQQFGPGPGKGTAEPKLPASNRQAKLRVPRAGRSGVTVRQRSKGVLAVIADRPTRCAAEFLCNPNEMAGQSWRDGAP